MLRRLILATGTLGLILLAYGIYRLRNAPPDQAPSNLPEIPQAVTSAPASQVGVLGMRDVRIAPGHGSKHIVYDAEGRERYVLEFAEWQPISENEASLVRPKITIYLPSGQITQIQAETGQVVFELAGKRNVRPKRGWLRNGVRIDIDRTTRRWRQRHPDRQRLKDHPEYIVSVRMDRLFFDTDLSLIRTDGPVKIHTTELDLTTKGLSLTWDQPRNRLENLDMPNGGVIELRRLVGLPGDATRLATMPTSQPKPPRAAVEASAASLNGVAAAPATAPATQTAPAEFVDEYRATFHGPLTAEQFRGNQSVARLDADRLLEILFTFGRRERQAASVEDRAAPTGAPATQPAASQQVQTKLVVRWSGPLKVVPVARHPAGSAPRKALFKALGRKVVLKDQHNTITCNEFVYDAVRRSGRIQATGAALARFSDDRGRYLTGPDIRFDRTAGLLEVLGKGEAVEPAGAGLGGSSAPLGGSSRGATVIRWKDRLLVRFRPEVRTAGDADRTGSALDRPGNLVELAALLGPAKAEASAAGPTSGLVAESAQLWGNVFIQQGTESIAAEELLVRFFAPQNAPQKKARAFGPIRSAHAVGSVTVVGKEQRISADVLDVTFKLVEPDRSSPLRAVARGHASATQRNASLVADYIDATLKELPVAQAGSGTANQPAYLARLGREQTRRTRLAVVAIKASGSVHVSDPDQALDIAAEQLEATLPDGRQIKDVVLTAPAETPAAVAVQDYALSAAHIEADLVAEDLRVPGPGVLRLLVKQGLEGTRLQEPRPLEIRWSGRMQMWGQKNLAVFEKAVRATTQGTAVAADRLTVQFAPVQPASQEPRAAREPTIANRLWWQIGRLVAAASESLRGRSPTEPNRLSARAQVRREPIAVFAEGNAVALSSRYDKSGRILTSRLRLAGPTLIADLRRRQLEIRGKGTLLLEDYRLAKAAARLATLPAESPVPERRLSGAGPSQTAFSWVNGMTYVLPERLAIFDGVVDMVHRSGSKVVLGKELAQALGANVELLRTLPGRIASLQCENLIVQFAPPSDQKAEPRDEWLERAQLQKIAATGNVYLREAGRWLTASRLLYAAQTDTFFLEGTPAAQARLFEQDEARGRFVITKAPLIRYNRRTGQIVAPGASVVGNVQ